MPIEWREKMAIGHEVIDTDHKRLIELLNTYEDAVKDKNLKKLEETFDGLMDYTRTHFAREENIQRSIGYLDNINHMGIHAELLMRMDKYHKGLKKTHKVDLKDVSKFLYDWLIGHVMSEDKKMIPFIEAARKSKEI